MQIHSNQYIQMNLCKSIFKWSLFLFLTSEDPEADEQSNGAANDSDGDRDHGNCSGREPV